MRADGSVLGHEALLRARVGDQIVGPDHPAFLAGSAPWSEELDALAADLALRAGAVWSEPSQLLFVNCRPQALPSLETWLHRLGHAAAEHDVPLTSVVVELHEDQPVDDLPRLAALVLRAGASGLRFALDDVQTDLRSVRLVRALRPDFVKLDGQVVRALTHPGGQPHLRRFLEVVAATGAEAVAEQVETPEQAAAVLDYGIPLFQGWLMGGPVVDARPATGGWSAVAPAAVTAGVRLADTTPRRWAAGTKAR